MTRPARTLARFDLTAHALHVIVPLLALSYAETVCVRALAAVFLFLGGFALMHDTMHGSLGLSARKNGWLLSAAAALIGVGGHATRAQHLVHHARPGAADDHEMADGETHLLSILGRGVFGLVDLVRASWRTRRHTARRERGEWWFVLVLHGVLSALDERARLFSGLSLALHVTLPLWGGLLPHHPPAALLRLVSVLHGTYLPLFTGLRDHLAHHEAPRIPTYSLTRGLRLQVRQATPTWRVPCPKLALTLAAVLIVGCRPPKGLSQDELLARAEEALFEDDTAAFAHWLDSGLDARGMLTDPLSGTRTPLVVAACDGSRTTQGKLARVGMLLDRGADVDARVESGPWMDYTALMMAARYGNAAVVALLLSRGANVNLVAPHNGHTALMSAAGFPEVAKALLRAGAERSAVDRAGRSALTFAAMMGCKPAFDYLLSQGLDPDRQDRHGKSARDYLREFGSDSVPQGVCWPE